MALPSRSVCLYADGAQNPVYLDRGIPRYVSEHARAIEALAPSLVHSVLLNPALPVTGNLSPFLGKGLLSWVSEVGPSERPAVYHVMSPLEAKTPLDVLWPRWARDARVATVVTLYDLIPLVFPHQYLPDRVLRQYYMARVELVRRADAVLALSEHTAEDAVERLRIDPERVHVIQAASSGHFAGMYRSASAAWARLSRNLSSVRPGFMLSVGYFEYRKNMEGLIAAYGRLPPAMRAQHQLVLVCAHLKSGQPEFIRSLADAAGIGPDELVLSDQVSDFDLGALYRACELFVFPSFYEGFGLPILEAMSCGAPVAASATTTGPEVLGDLEGTFEPNDPDSIAACLAGVLGSEDALERLRARSRRRVGEYTWERVAERSFAAYEQAVAGVSRRRPRRRRPRVAFVTPWPPERSWMAGYNARLVGELGRHVDVDVVVAGSVDTYVAPSGGGVRLIDAREFERFGDLRQHDRVLYCMGNSEVNRHVYGLLLARRGVVVLHDVRLTGFYGWYAGVERPEDPEGALTERFEEMYGDRLPEEAMRGLASAVDRQAALGLYMTSELQSHAERCLVHSKFAREVLELECGPLDRRAPVSVVPFGLPEAALVPRGAAGASPLIVSLGSVYEADGIAAVIDAFALLAGEMPEARLVITGGAVGSAEAERWRRYADEHAPGASVELAGEVSAAWYAGLLRTADLAVQLQRVSGGEAPVAAADCLASGVPTILTDLGWASELPGGVAEKVPLSIAPQELKDRMVSMLRDDGRRAAVSRAALEHARAHSVSAAADAYLDALGLN